jgi:hypothetical protein
MEGLLKEFGIEPSSEWYFVGTKEEGDAVLTDCYCALNDTEQGKVVFYILDIVAYYEQAAKRRMALSLEWGMRFSIMPKETFSRNTIEPVTLMRQACSCGF